MTQYEIVQYFVDNADPQVFFDLQSAGSADLQCDFQDQPISPIILLSANALFPSVLHCQRLGALIPAADFGVIVPGLEDVADVLLDFPVFHLGNSFDLFGLLTQCVQSAVVFGVQKFLLWLFGELRFLQNDSLQY